MTPTSPSLMNLCACSLLSILMALASAGCHSAPRKDSQITFRVMTYNIHHGEGLDKKVDLQRIADLIKREQADIVALQEVDKGVRRTDRRDLPAELSALTGLACVFSNNFNYQGGQYGNAVLTRFPVKRWTNTYFKMLSPGEQRGLLQLVLDVHGRELVIMDTHIDYRKDDTERLQNAAELHEILHQYGGRPIILCGDFNDTPGSPTHSKIAGDFTDAWAAVGAGGGFTIPAENPSKRIDYLWVSKSTPFIPVKAWVPESAASDHLPVVAEMQFE